MLEIPESYTLARQLNETVKGKKIAKAVANASPHGFAFYFGDPAGYNALLCGKEIKGAAAYAGQVEISAGGAAILFSDGVNARFFQRGEALPEKHQLLLAFKDGSALVCTVQMYGGLWAYSAGTNDNFYYTAAKEKPSPLTGAFDEKYFGALMDSAKPNLSLKAFLATEQRIPGLGNGVLQDILFNAHLHPKTKLMTLSISEKKKLFESVKETLADMAFLGGRDTETNLFGKAGGYRSKLSAKTFKAGCPVCGSEIKKEAYMGGNIYSCTSCQH